jgi:hypothetical protein
MEFFVGKGARGCEDPVPRHTLNDQIDRRNNEKQKLPRGHQRPNKSHEPRKQHKNEAEPGNEKGIGHGEAKQGKNDIEREHRSRREKFRAYRDRDAEFVPPCPFEEQNRRRGQQHEQTGRARQRERHRFRLPCLCPSSAFRFEAGPLPPFLDIKTRPMIHSLTFLQPFEMRFTHKPATLGANGEAADQIFFLRYTAFFQKSRFVLRHLVSPLSIETQLALFETCPPARSQTPKIRARSVMICVTSATVTSASFIVFRFRVVFAAVCRGDHRSDARNGTNRQRPVA